MDAALNLDRRWLVDTAESTIAAWRQAQVVEVPEELRARLSTSSTILLVNRSRRSIDAVAQIESLERVSSQLSHVKRRTGYVTLRASFAPSEIQYAYEPQRGTFRLFEPEETLDILEGRDEQSAVVGDWVKNMSRSHFDRAVHEHLSTLISGSERLAWFWQRDRAIEIQDQHTDWALDPEYRGSDEGEGFVEQPAVENLTGPVEPRPERPEDAALDMLSHFVETYLLVPVGCADAIGNGVRHVKADGPVFRLSFPDSEDREETRPELDLGALAGELDNDTRAARMSLRAVLESIRGRQ